MFLEVNDLRSDLFIPKLKKDDSEHRLEVVKQIFCKLADQAAVQLPETIEIKAMDRSYAQEVCLIFATQEKLVLQIPALWVKKYKELFVDNAKNLDWRDDEKFSTYTKRIFPQAVWPKENVSESLRKKIFVSNMRFFKSRPRLQKMMIFLMNRSLRIFAINITCTRPKLECMLLRLAV